MSDPDRPAPERALVVTAHPDDVDFGAAGTVAAWTDAGIVVTYCIVTDGNAGARDATIDPDELAVTRHAEQEAAANEVGVSEVIWLGYPDGQVTASLDLRWDLTRVIRTVLPNRVICPSPERNWASIFASHPDHLAVGEATLCAVYPDSRNPFAFAERGGRELAAHVVDELWVMAGPNPDTYVDVTEVFDRKAAALRHHVSQLDPGRDTVAFLRGWMSATAAAGGLPEGRLAEAFLRRAVGERPQAYRGHSSSAAASGASGAGSVSSVDATGDAG